MLSLVALGEPVPPEDLAHLRNCPECGADADQLARVVTAVRTGPADDVTTVAPVTPPPSVWAGIAAATGVTVSPRAERTATAPARSPLPPAPLPAPASHPDPAPLPMGRVPGQRRGPARRTLLAVAASMLVLGAAGGSLVTWQLARPDAEPQARVVEQVTLGALPLAPGASGTAQVVDTGDGPRLRVVVRSVRPLTGEFYEVWLIDRSVTRMVPVGVLRGGNGEFVIPPGLDLADYSVVDVSVQAPGDPRHSGDSVLRGVIQA